MFLKILYLFRETIVIETMTTQNLTLPSCWTLPCWSHPTCFSCWKKMPFDSFLATKSNSCDGTRNKTHFFSGLFRPARVSSCRRILSYKAKQRVATKMTTNKPGEESRNRRAFLDIFRLNIPPSLSFFSQYTCLFRHFSFQFFFGKTKAPWVSIKGSRWQTNHGILLL